MEGLILGCIGGLIGVVLAWGLSYVVSTIGIPMPPPPGMLEGFDAEDDDAWPVARWIPA